MGKESLLAVNRCYRDIIIHVVISLHGEGMTEIGLVIALNRKALAIFGADNLRGPQPLISGELLSLHFVVQMA